MTEARNPYAPPTAHVADPIEQPATEANETFVPGGRRLPIGRGVQWLTEARKLFAKRPWRWMASTLLLIVILVIPGKFPPLNLVSGFLGPLIVAGIVLAADQQRRTGTFDFRSLFGGFTNRLRPLLVVGCVSLAMLPVSYACFAFWVGPDVANTILFKGGRGVDPAVLLGSGYWLALLTYLALALPAIAATYLAAPLIVLAGQPAGVAMKMSLIGSLRNMLPGLLFSICALLLFLLSLIPLGLGIVVSLPILMITPYAMYRDIFIVEGSGAR